LVFGHRDATRYHDGGPFGGGQPTVFEGVPVDPGAVFDGFVADLSGALGRAGEQCAEHPESMWVVVEMEVVAFGKHCDSGQG
jgi:hypothetical protein